LAQNIPPTLPQMKSLKAKDRAISMDLFQVSLQPGAGRGDQDPDK